MITTNHTDQLSSCCTVPSTEQDAAEVDLGSCCTVPSSSAVDALDQVRAEATPSQEISAIRAAGFRLLLDEGRPIERREWASAAGVARETLEDILTRPGIEGRAQLDDEGRLLGIAGLTVEPTRHRLTIGERTRWTWCALDAVGILGALEATGSIYSTDPRSGNPVEIGFEDGTPTGDATLFILGGYDGANVVEDWCPMVNFFATRADAEAWVADNGVEGDVVSVAQVAENAAAMWRPVTEPGSPQVC
jgi:alkylmercury lyase